MKAHRIFWIVMLIIAAMAIVGTAVFIKPTAVNLFTYSSGDWLRITEIERGQKFSIIRIAYEQNSGSVADSIGIICGVATLAKERGFQYFSMGEKDTEGNQAINFFKTKQEGDSGPGIASREKVIVVDEMLILLELNGKE